MPGSPGQPFIRSKRGVRDCHPVVTKALQTWSPCKQGKHKLLIQHPGLTHSLVPPWGWKLVTSPQLGNRLQVPIWVQPQLAHPLRKRDMSLFRQPLSGMAPTTLRLIHLLLLLTQHQVTSLKISPVECMACSPLQHFFFFPQWYSLRPLFSSSIVFQLHLW